MARGARVFLFVPARVRSGAGHARYPVQSGQLFFPVEDRAQGGFLASVTSRHHVKTYPGEIHKIEGLKSRRGGNEFVSARLEIERQSGIDLNQSHWGLTGPEDKISTPRAGVILKTRLS